MDAGDRDFALGALGTAAGLGSQDLFRQLGAAESLGGFQQSDLARALSGNISAAGIAGQDADRSLDAQQMNVANMLAGIGALPGLADYGDRWIGQRLLGGGLTEGFQQAAADDYFTRFVGDRDRQWDLAQRYANLLTGAPVGQTTTNTPGGMDYLGMGLAGLAAYPQIAAGGSAVLGGLGSLAGLMFSDRRLKRDIVPLGRTRGAFHGIGSRTFGMSLGPSASA